MEENTKELKGVYEVEISYTGTIELNGTIVASNEKEVVEIVKENLGHFPDLTIGEPQLVGNYIETNEDENSKEGYLN